MDHAQLKNLRHTILSPFCSVTLRVLKRLAQAGWLQSFTLLSLSLASKVKMTFLMAEHVNVSYLSLALMACANTGRA